MQLVILCRTQGRNLSDFMFREGSNVAIHILDNIAIEAAGMAYKELKYVAERLYRDALWKSLSLRRTRRQGGQVEDKIIELLSLSRVSPLLDVGATLPAISAVIGPDSGVEWSVCCLAMKEDESFSPNWLLRGPGVSTHLFFVPAEDVFLLLKVDEEGPLREAQIVEKDELVTAERRHGTAQRFLNFVLHFMWFSL